MATSVQALVFDFDGLILDTETPEIEVWKGIYKEHGFDFPLEQWWGNVGRWGVPLFDPAVHLHELTHDSLDMEALRKRHHDESAVLIERQPILDGVQEYLSEAKRLGLRLGVASSSERYWVESHLTRLGLVSRFDRIICGNDVTPGHTKPMPDLYLKALEALGVAATDAIAFEDSPPGVKAAQAAGIFVVAVPNPTTARLKLDGANLTLRSLAELSLEDLLRKAIR